MRLIFRCHVYIFLAAILIGCAPAPKGCKPIRALGGRGSSNQISIDKPGLYCLREDLHARLDFPDHRAEARLIQIFASDVVLDLGGHTLGRGAIFVQKGGHGIEIVGEAKNIVIRNGILENFDAGVYRYRSAGGMKKVRSLPMRTETGFQFGPPSDRVTLDNLTFKNCKEDLAFIESVADQSALPN